MRDLTPVMKNQEALGCALAIPICACPDHPGHVAAIPCAISKHTWISWVKISSIPGHVKGNVREKVRKWGMLDRHLSTRNWWNKVVFHSDTTSEFTYGLSCKNSLNTEPIILFSYIFSRLVVSECLKAKCLTELLNPGKISRQLTSACLSTAQHWY